MAAKSMEKFRELDANELGIREHELGEQIFRLRFQLTTGQAESVKKLREARRDLARVKTLAREQELGLRRAAPAQESGAKKAEKPAPKARATASKKKSSKKK
ncbi:MAG: 50S ribosomal protein L29 [Candidatus Acidiferrales bacterium]